MHCAKDDVVTSGLLHHLQELEIINMGFNSVVSLASCPFCQRSLRKPRAKMRKRRVTTANAFTKSAVSISKKRHLLIITNRYRAFSSQEDPDRRRCGRGWGGHRAFGRRGRFSFWRHSRWRRVDIDINRYQSSRMEVLQKKARILGRNRLLNDIEKSSI